MRATMMTAVLVAGLLLPWAADAQAPGPTQETRLEIEMKRRRHIVRPPIVPETVTQDVERATADLDRAAREERLIREVTRPTPRRPDLDYDVRSGIQAQTIQRALRR